MLKYLIGTVILCSSVQCFSAADLSERQAMLQDLEALKYSISIKYAPKEWKNEYLNWDLDTAFEKAKGRIFEDETICSKDYQSIFKDFLNSTHDYHVRALFYSTEWSFFPFFIKEVNGKYFLRSLSDAINFSLEDALFISDMEEIENPEFYEQQLSQFHVGDEILALNGVPIKEIIETLIDTELGGDRTPTGYALAERQVFFRRGKFGEKVPSGSFDVTVLHQGANQAKTYRFPWFHVPEWVTSKTPKAPASPIENLVKKDFSVQYAKDLFAVQKVKNLKNKTIDEEEDDDLDFREKGFLPGLGEVIWETPPYFDIYAYLYKNKKGQKIGYLYLSSFNYSEFDAEYHIGEILEAITKFQEADALVLDICNNPGGNLFYMYAVLSVLSDQNLLSLPEREIMTQEDVYNAALLYKLVEAEDAYEDDEDPVELDISGYALNEADCQNIKTYCKQLIDNWSQGKSFTDPLYLFGIEKIRPNPISTFSKPILLLINELDFSCADLFPAILQDNKRATLFGKKTAGAGGYVRGYTHNSRFGVSGYTLTGSLCLRQDGTVIENLGVTPDIPYELTERDLKQNYADYIEAVNREVEKLIE